MPLLGKTSTCRGILIWLPILIIPLLFTPGTLDPVLHIRFIAFVLYVLVLGVWAGIGFFRKNKPEITKSMLMFSLLLLTYWVLTGIGLFINSINLADALFDWLKLLAELVSILLIYLVFRDYGTFIQKLSKALVILGLMISFIGLYHFFLINGINPPHHNFLVMDIVFSDKNIVAENLLLILPFAVFVILSMNGTWRILASLCASLILFLLIVSLSRVVWLACILSTILLVVFFYDFVARLTDDKLQSRKILILVAAVFVLIPISILIYSRFGSMVTFRKQYSSLINLEYGSGRDHIVLWGKSIQQAKEHPFLGSGLQSWKTEIMKYGTSGLKSADNISFYRHPYNDYIRKLCEQGALGLLLFLCIISWMLRMLFTIMKKSHDDKTRMFFMMMFFALCSYLVVSFFSFPEERMDYQMILLFILGAILIHYEKGDAGRILIHRNIGLFILLPAMVLLTFSLFLGISRFKSEVHNREAFLARDAGDWNKCISEIDKAKTSWYQMDPVSTPLDWYRGIAEHKLGNRQEACKDFLAAFRLSPDHQFVLNMLGSCYEEAGVRQTAMNYFEKALAISPTYQEAWLNLSELRYSTGQILPAYRALHQVDTASKDPRYKTLVQSILTARINQLKDSIPEAVIQKKLLDISHTEKWVYDLYIKSVKNNIDFKKQVLLDIVWILKNEQHQDSLAEQIRQRYML